MAIKFNEAVLESAGVALKKKFELAASDRIVLEQQWLRNLRQYRGIYDPEVEKLIPKERSKVYPRDTYVKVTGFEAKMMEMMFPATEANFSIARTTYPSIDQADLQNIINGLRQQKQQAAQQGAQAAQQAGQPAPPVDPATLEPTSEEIEKAVDAFADARAENMFKECEDQLQDIDYPDLSKRALRSGAIYGWGVSEGPTAKLVKERQWLANPQGEFEAKVTTMLRPVFSHESIWNLFPDLAAKQWEDMEYMFQRKVFTRHELTDLKKRPDFMAAKIDAFLLTNADGNYKSRTYENDLNVIKLTTNLNKRDSRKYEVIRYFGFLSAHELRDMGMDIPDSQMGQDILVDFWLLEGVPVKAGLAAFGERPSDMFHAYIHMDDEDSGLTGIGIPQILRDSQMSRCAVRRMIMDNGAAVAGPIFVVDESAFARGKEVQQFHSFATVYVDGEDKPNFRLTDAVMQLSTTSHIPELSAFEETLKKDVDMESNLPSWTLGNAQPLGEAFRTSQNMSQMTGGANVILKDNVRSYDRYTKSFVGSLVKWNMDSELNPKKEIKGDFNVQPKGTISLVAKEVHGAALDQLSTMLTPQERLYINTRDLLIDRFKSRDLNPDRIKTKEECAAIDKQQAELAANQTQLAGGESQAKTQSLSAKAAKDTASAQIMQEQNQAQIAQLLADVQAKLANAKGVSDKNQLESTKTLLEDLRERSLAGAEARKESNGPVKRAGKKAGGEQAL
jgi:hypothetical protein